MAVAFMIYYFDGYANILFGFAWKT